tara:strand:- start:11032 stop:11253 length:222 start_codon:yes stop_codon:yes gene_type:complete
MESIQEEYKATLENITNQIDAMIYEIENFYSDGPLKTPTEYKHDSFPIIRRLKEAKKLSEESLMMLNTKSFAK